MPGLFSELGAGFHQTSENLTVWEMAPSTLTTLNSPLRKISRSKIKRMPEASLSMVALATIPSCCPKEMTGRVFGWFRINVSDGKSSLFCRQVIAKLVFCFVDSYPGTANKPFSWHSRSPHLYPGGYFFAFKYTIGWRKLQKTDWSGQKCSHASK